MDLPTLLSTKNLSWQAEDETTSQRVAMGRRDGHLRSLTSKGRVGNGEHTKEKVRVLSPNVLTQYQGFFGTQKAGFGFHSARSGSPALDLAVWPSMHFIQTPVSGYAVFV